MNFTVQLANKMIQIESIHTDLREFCKDYVVENYTPDFYIHLTQDDIIYEKQHATDQSFSETYLETLALLRKISKLFPAEKRFLIHGAAISYEDKAYLFTAPSGTGKSTHIRLWKKYLGDKVKIVNGDKPFVSLDQDSEGKIQPLIYGTPWSGKERWHRNCSQLLSGICFLQRSTTNAIRRLQPEECITMLLRQVYMPEDTVGVGHTLELIDLLVNNVPLYLLSCDISEEAVRCSFESLTGLPYPT